MAPGLVSAFGRKLKKKDTITNILCHLNYSIAFNNSVDISRISIFAPEVGRTWWGRKVVRLRIPAGGQLLAAATWRKFGGQPLGFAVGRLLLVNGAVPNCRLLRTGGVPNSPRLSSGGGQVSDGRPGSSYQRRCRLSESSFKKGYSEDVFKYRLCLPGFRTVCEFVLSAKRAWPESAGRGRAGRTEAAHPPRICCSFGKSILL
jgi:hypothetical protein